MKTYRWSISPPGNLSFIAVLLLGMGLLIFPPQLLAQSSADGTPTLITHLRNELQAKDPMQRNLALLDINALTYCSASCSIQLRSLQDKEISVANESGVGSVVDLQALVPDLLMSYRQGPTDGHRLLALYALLHVGNEQSLEQLIENGGFRSPRVQEATQRGLASFYLEKYPELSEKALRTNRLSLDDVARAKVFRVKVEKKAARQAKKAEKVGGDRG